MEISAYREMAAFEDTHWWFVGRRRIIDSLLSRLPLVEDARILEIGCGSGGNLAMLTRYGRLWAGEYDTEARALALARGITDQIEACELPTHLPFDDELFDLILMLDVLEHIEDDVGSLKAVRDRLTDDGWLVLAVPMHPILWSAHDERHHHKRRYRVGELRARVREAGLRPGYQSYFNTLLFPAVALVRFVKNIRYRGRKEVPSDMTRFPEPLNRLFAALFGSERVAMGRFALPFGVSYIMSAQRAAVGA